MQSFLERRLGSDPEFQDIKVCQRQARISGITSVLIGSGTTYVTLKVSKILNKQPKYIPLVSLGVGVCCGYIKSAFVVKNYRDKQRLQRGQNERTNLATSDSVDSSTPSLHVSSDQTEPSKLHSKYGDEDFFTDEKDVK